MDQEDLDRLPWGPQTYQGIALLIFTINIGITSFFLILPSLQHWPVSPLGLWIIAVSFGGPGIILPIITIYGCYTIHHGKPFSLFPFITNEYTKRFPLTTHRHILGSLLITLTWATILDYFLMGTHYFSLFAPIAGIVLTNLAFYTVQPDLFRIPADAQPITLPWTYPRYKLLLLLALLPGLISIDLLIPLIRDQPYYQIGPGIHLFQFLFGPLTLQYLLYPLEHGASPPQIHRWDLTTRFGRLRVHRYLQAILLGQVTWGLLAPWNQWLQYIPMYNLLILLTIGAFLGWLLLAILTPIHEPPPTTHSQKESKK